MDPSVILSVESGPHEPNTQGGGVFLRRPGLLALVGIFLLAIWFQQIPTAMLTGLFLSAALLARAWSSLSLKRVMCTRTLRESRFFPGEFADLKVLVTNRKPLPLPWFRVEQELPLSLCAELSAKPSQRPGYGLLQQEGSLLWYRSMRWGYRIRCDRRGYYEIGSMIFASGDIFGLYSSSLQLPLCDRIIVYPRIFSMEKASLPSLQPMGESRSLRRMVQDPTRAIGVREYRCGDSLRHIHWKASARSRQWQVKVFEPTTSFKVALFLSVESFHHNQTFDEETFELAISTAASVAHFVVKRGSPVGLFVNTRAADSDQAVSVPPGGSRDQLPLLLEHMAKVTASASEPFDRFLDRERRRLSAGTTLVLLFGSPPASLPSVVSALRAEGYRLLVLLVGDQGQIPVHDGIPWVNVRNPQDLGGLS